MQKRTADDNQVKYEGRRNRAFLFANETKQLKSNSKPLSQLLQYIKTTLSVGNNLF
jgi:hypothetical protein